MLSKHRDGGTTTLRIWTKLRDIDLDHNHVSKAFALFIPPFLLSTLSFPFFFKIKLLEQTFSLQTFFSPSHTHLFRAKICTLSFIATTHSPFFYHIPTSLSPSSPLHSFARSLFILQLLGLLL